jgi:hypothetical protein
MTIALTPLIGVFALGAEAGSWYVTKQHAQNAADAAAYAGALQVACAMSGSSGCNTSQTYVYRGKESAAQNNFCNPKDSSYPGANCPASLGANVSQSVAIDRGIWSGGAWTNSASGRYVRATVQQTQPAYLAAVLGFTTVTIGGQAITQIKTLTHPPCALALTGSIGFQGSPNINAPNCGMASNDTAANALNFTGGGMTIDLATLIAAGGCAGSTSFCNQAHTYVAPITNPFTNLNADLTTLCGASPSLPTRCGLSACSGSSLVAYTASTPCTNNNFKTTGNTAVTLSTGVYFISGTLTLKGGSSITSPAAGATFVLLPGATIDTSGGGTLTLSGPATAPSTSSLPAAFQSDASLFQYMAMYDASATTAQFGGTSNISLSGTIYAPTALVTFQGDPVINVGGGSSGCGELIGASISFNGNATFDDSGCPPAVTPGILYVQPVQ